MTYGKEIGRKFYEDGSVRRYPGNTVVAALKKDTKEFEIMTLMRNMIIENGFDGDMILLPSDSYHMTVIRGVNDQVRTDNFWPEALSKDTPMEKVDDYISAAVASVPMPQKMKMKFDRIRLSATAMLVTLLPANETEDKMLRDYRNKVADAIGLYLPKHHEYRFHITLAYTRIIPEGEKEEKMKAMIEKMDSILSSQEEFYITEPYMAFYDDMLKFHKERIPR